MSDEIDKMNQRTFVSNMYDGPRWKRRVRNMTDAQVFAIYMRQKDKPKPKKQESEGDEAPF